MLKIIMKSTKMWYSNNQPHLNTDAVSTAPGAALSIIFTHH